MGKDGAALASSEDFDRVPRDRLDIAGYQAGEGDPTTPYGMVPMDDADYGRELEDAHRVLVHYTDDAGADHWYWLTGGLDSSDDLAWRIVDLMRSGGYRELSE